MRKTKQLTLSAVGHVAALLRATLGPRAKDACGLLMYHRVVPEPARCPAPTWNVTPERLRRQLAGLLDLGYRSWPLRRLLEAGQRGEQLPPKLFAVTFDDGYANNLHYALPVLRDLQIEATVFLATGYINSTRPFPFDDWECAGAASVSDETWRPLTLNECRELAASDLIELAAHTHWHQNYAGYPDMFLQDAQQCMRFVFDYFGIKQPMLSLPFGEYDAALLHACRTAGFSCALTTQPTLVTADTDPFGWGRLAVFQHDTPTTLAAKLAGWYGPFATTWHKVNGGGWDSAARARPEFPSAPAFADVEPADPHAFASTTSES